MNFDFETQPLGTDGDGNDVFLRDIWPSDAEIAALMDEFVTAELFDAGAEGLYGGTQAWQELEAPEGDIFAWDEGSTYVRRAPYFDGIGKAVEGFAPISGARVLANLGDFITTDHISPAGSIASDSTAAKYLAERGVDPGYVQHLRFASRQP